MSPVATRSLHGVDHALLGLDENRNHLLESDFLQSVVSLLEGYAATIPENRKEPVPLSMPDLKIVKTAIGVLLNSSVGYGRPSFQGFH